MPGRKSEENRNVQRRRIGVYQAVHRTSPPFFSGNVREVSHDDGFEPFQFAAAFEGLQHPVDAGNVFAHLFDQQHRRPVERIVHIGPVEGADQRPVAAREPSPRPAGGVQRMGRRAVGVHSAPQGVLQRQGRGVALRGVAQEIDGHGPVDRFDACLLQGIVHDGNVAVSDQPFRMFAEGFEIQGIQDADGAVSSPVEEDGFDRGVVEHALQVVGSLPVRSGEPDAVAAVEVFAQPDVQAPRFEGADESRVAFLGQLGRDRYHGDRISLPQKRRADEGNGVGGLRPGGEGR